VIVDTSALLAYFDRNEPAHLDVAAAIETAVEPLVVSPYVVAELDYLILTRHGIQAEQAVLQELGGGAWELADMPVLRLNAARAIVAQYADLPIGVTDASNIVLADAYRTRTIVTLDLKHFSVLRFDDGTAPTVVPVRT
jgi:predicted nucleic acid-binding protein